MPVAVSVIIISQNEEKRIRACLQSVAWADEIIIVDSGSTDQTLNIAREFTDKIFINQDWPGFGPQKKLAESRASNEWILSIDCDEVVSNEMHKAIKSFLDSSHPDTVYRANRLPHFFGRYIRHSGWHPDRIVRLYNKNRYHFNDARVHESVECPNARIVDLDGYLYHYTFQSLQEYIEKRNRYAQDWANSQYEKGRHSSITKALTHSTFAFIRHYFLKLGFLDGYAGFLISAIQMQYTFNKYNYLMDLNRIDSD